MKLYFIVKNNLKRLIAQGRVKPLYKVTDEGKFVIFAFERKSGLSKKKGQVFYLDEAIEVSVKPEAKLPLNSTDIALSKV